MGTVNGIGDGEGYRPVAGGYMGKSAGEEFQVSLEVHFASFPHSKS